MQMSMRFICQGHAKTALSAQEWKPPAAVPTSVSTVLLSKIVLAILQGGNVGLKMHKKESNHCAICFVERIQQFWDVLDSMVTVSR